MFILLKTQKLCLASRPPHQTGCAPQPLWLRWRRQKLLSLPPVEPRFLGRPALSLHTILTEPPWPHAHVQIHGNENTDNVIRQINKNILQRCQLYCKQRNVWTEMLKWKRRVTSSVGILTRTGCTTDSVRLPVRNKTSRFSKGVQTQSVAHLASY